MIAHALSPAVPEEATERVRQIAVRENWRVEYLAAGEFQDKNYLANPRDRCYYCKTHLYRSLRELTLKQGLLEGTLLSGANCDDLEEYRPGLLAAAAMKVRHPFIEAGMGKEDIRVLARELGLEFSEIPASPCLASRVYTGTPITPERLKAAETGEAFLKKRAGIDVVRCRVRKNEMLVEALDQDRPKISPQILRELLSRVAEIWKSVEAVALDPEPYRPGRAFRPSER